MSRREIRRMLQQRRATGTESVHRVRPWAVGVLLVGVLAAGVGIGIFVGHGLGGDKDDAGRWEQAEIAVARPPVAASTAPGLTPGPYPHADVSDANATPDTADPEAADLPPPPSRQQGMAALLAPSAPVPPVPAGGQPAWLRYAVAPVKPVAGRPMIAIVIDDLGVDRRRSEKVVAMKGPLTLAWMTYAENLRAMTEQARKHGHELMVHVPMQPMSRSYDPGPDVLEVDLPPDEIRRRLRWGLSRFDGFVGINNHMGSRFTANAAGMAVVMEEVKARGLLFLDSLTTQNSVGAELAKRAGVPFASRQVFLDNDMNVTAVNAQLAHAEAMARKYGAAIAIGHPHDATIEALTAWLPTLEAKGLALVTVTTIVKAGAARH